MKAQLIPYELLKTKGFPGVEEWYESLDIQNAEGFHDASWVHVNDASWSKMIDALCEYYPDCPRQQVMFTLMNIGPSGSYNDVPLDNYSIKRR